jgi:hypothetical protein
VRGAPEKFQSSGRNIGRNVALGPYDFPVFQSDFDDADRFMPFRLNFNVSAS